MRGSGLEIVLLVTGAVLATRTATWLSGRVTRRIDRQAGQADAVLRSEASKHRHAVTQVVTWVVLVLVYCVTAVLVVQRLGLPLTGFVAPATVVGVALGFGAQRIVQDVLAQVINLSRDWARAVVDVPVPATADVQAVSELLAQVGAKTYHDQELHDLLLDEPAVMGVEDIGGEMRRLGRVRRSTVLLWAFFLIMLALWIAVRPQPSQGETSNHPRARHAAHVTKRPGTLRSARGISGSSG